MLPKGPSFQEKLKAVDACLNSVKHRGQSDHLQGKYDPLYAPRMGSVMMTAVLGSAFKGGERRQENH